MKAWTKEQYADYMAEHRAKFAPQSKVISGKADDGLESNLLRKALNWASEKGFPCWHDRSRGKNQAGWPDLILIMPKGRVVFVELKAAGGKLRKEQQALKRQFEFLGHYIHVCKSYKRFLEIMGGETNGQT